MYLRDQVGNTGGYSYATDYFKAFCAAKTKTDRETMSKWQGG